MPFTKAALTALAMAPPTRISCIKAGSVACGHNRDALSIAAEAEEADRRWFPKLL